MIGRPGRVVRPPFGSSSSFPASITSVVDAPRLVSSDPAPTRPEWAVIRDSTPAARAAAANRSPAICGESGTTRSSGDELAAARSVRRARATPSFHRKASLENRWRRGPEREGSGRNLPACARLPSHSGPPTTARTILPVPDRIAQRVNLLVVPYLMPNGRGHGRGTLMDRRFFEQPILNSPYEYPSQHWELDETGQPTNRVVPERRKVSFITPIPNPGSRRKPNPRSSSTRPRRRSSPAPSSTT